MIEARLEADGDGTRLLLEERGVPLAELAGNGAGWQAHVEDLAAHVAGRERTEWRARWAELVTGVRRDDRPPPLTCTLSGARRGSR